MLLHRAAIQIGLRCSLSIANLTCVHMNAKLPPGIVPAHIQESISTNIVTSAFLNYLSTRQTNAEAKATKYTYK